MRTGKLSLENIITGLFIMLMGSVFLLCAQGYRTISDGKYHMFIIVCGGYCAVMLFMAFQRFVLGSGGLARHEVLLKDAADPAMEEAAGAAAGASAAVGGHATRGYDRIGAVTRTAAVIYIILTLISALCSDYFPETIFGSGRHEGTLTIAIYGLTFIFVSRHYRPHLLHAAVFGASVIAFDIISLLQAAGMNPFGLYPDGLSWADRNVKYSGEFIGTIGNADLVSAFLCVAIPLTAVVGGHLVFGSLVEGSRAVPVSILDEVGEIEKNINKKRVNKKLSISNRYHLPDCGRAFARTARSHKSDRWPACYGICLPDSRAGRGIHIFRFPKRKMIAAYLAALVLAGCAAGAFIYAETSLPGTAGELHEVMHGNIDDSFGTSRIYIYRNILEHVPSHLLLGTGPDTIGHMDIEPFQRYDAERGVTVTAHIDTAHNEFLNVLACQGIAALCAYVAFALGVMAAALCGMVNCAAALRGRVGSAAALRRNVNCAAVFARPGGGAGYSDAAAAAAASTALALSVTAYLVQSMFSFSSCTTAPYFWITGAILIAASSSNN